MATIRTILDNKGPTIHTIGLDASVLDAAGMMNESKIGALVITSQEGPGKRVRGIFTERDVLRRVVAERKDPAKTRVGDVMTEEVVCAGPDTSIEEARTIFMDRRIRHLPIVDDEGHLLGMVSIGDLNAHELNGQKATIRYLNEYLYGQVPDPSLA